MSNAKDNIDQLEYKVRGLFTDFKSQLMQAKENYKQTGSLVPPSNVNTSAATNSNPTTTTVAATATAATTAPSITWQPSFDLVETDTEYFIFAELAGVKREDLVVEVHDRNLYLSGETHLNQQISQGTVRVQERRHGKFHRIIPIVAPVDANRVSAKFLDGVLEIRLAKIVQKSSVRVPIVAAEESDMPPSYPYQAQPASGQQQQTQYQAPPGSIQQVLVEQQQYTPSSQTSQSTMYPPEKVASYYPPEKSNYYKQQYQQQQQQQPQQQLTTDASSAAPEGSTSISK
jgi:HSP20 family protein